MGNEPRYFQPVKIGLSSVETGRERFGNPRDRNLPYDLPPRSQSRNNLTALSQHYDLYFCATRETIAVYVPKSDFQQLGRIPILQIVPNPLEPNAVGYIDERIPHTINHLMVGDLGNQEILLVSTDSGGVYAYHTKSIRDTIKESEFKVDTGEKSDSLGLRPFFNQWVQESAWGLSIHKEARMIAVSANRSLRVRMSDSTAKITVFAFALLPDDKPLPEDENEDEEMEDDECESGWNVWCWQQHQDQRPDRTQNWKIVLGGVEGHEENIPSISFVNSSEDPDGDWLLSTDTSGQMKIWKIWQSKCWREWDFTQLQLRPGMWHDRRARYDLGWLVAALDPRAFRITETMDEFSGWSRVPRYHGNDSGQSYDITNVVRLHVPGNSPFHPEAAQLVQEEVEAEDVAAQDQMFDLIDEELIEDAPEGDLKVNSASQNQIFSEGTSTSHRISSVEPQDERLSREARQTTSPPDSPDPTSARNGSEMDMVSGENNDDMDNESHHSDESFATADRRESRAAWGRQVNAQEAADERRMLFSEDIDWGSPEGESDNRRDEWISHTGGRKARVGTYVGPGGVILKLPFIPTIHCSALHMRLLVTPIARTAHYFCARILQQLLPPEVAQDPFARYDRLNMFQQVPELGIIVIATQIGRCAICTLTRRGREGRLGFRVDWVLPDRRQERLGQRPTETLLGIALGPIQAHLPAEPAEPVSEFDNDQMWTEDRVIDGTPTSFDPEVVVSGSYRNRRTKSQGAGTSAGVSDRYWKQSQRKVRNEKRPWAKPKMTEAWHGADSGRRYRLMLTYYDQTVLTYEIGRDAPEMRPDPSRRPRRKKQANT